MSSKAWRRLIPPLAGMAAALYGCMGPPYAKGTVYQLFPEAPRPQDRTYLADGRRIHYVEQAGGPQRILFIHGTPGDWQGWAPFLRDKRLQARATLLAVDRPGWGESGYGQIVPGLEAQARLLQPLLDAGARTLLVAHSFGGAVAARLAMDHPAQVSGLLLIAPTLSPELERPRWYDRLARLVPALLPQRLALSYRELKPLPADLRQMQPRWASLHMPITVIQGDDDQQVDPRTADYARRMLPAGLTRVVTVPGEGHWILWTRPEDIAGAILSMLDAAPSYRTARRAALRQAPSPKPCSNHVPSSSFFDELRIP
jgi:pimeloyl-ACP methyl ester carboxylesterase